MGLISDEIRATAKAALDSLLEPPENGGLGKHCRLVFPPQKTPCPNCFYDPQNKRSSGRYRPGGPQAFPYGTLCPVCGGKGTIEQEVSQDVVLGCNWNPKSWVLLPGMDPSVVNAQVANGRVQTKGKIEDLPRVLQSRKLVIETNLEGVVRWLFALDSEPADVSNIVQGCYFFCMWKRAGG